MFYLKIKQTNQLFFYKKSLKQKQGKMQRKTQKQKQKAQFFYIKIHYKSKTKKFIVRNLKQISLKQIKKAFSPPISAQNLKISILDNNSRQLIVKNEQELVLKLQSMKIEHGNEIHIHIIEQIYHSQNSQEQLQIPSGVSKIRSRSQDINLDCKTQAFSIAFDQLQATQQFLYNSMHLTDKKREQAKTMLYMAQKKLTKLTLEKRQTNTDELLKFLNQ